MPDFLTTPTAQAVLLIWALAVLVLVGFYLITKFRGQSGDDTPTANEMLTNFREMNLQGDIDEAEFRKIKTHMSQQLKSEVDEAIDKSDD